MDGQEYDEYRKGHKRQGEDDHQGHKVSIVMGSISMSMETDHCNSIFATLFFTTSAQIRSEGPLDIVPFMTQTIHLKDLH